MDKNLALEFVRVTEAAAIASARWMGKGNNHAADDAATKLMRKTFNNLEIDCIVTDCASCSAALKHETVELLRVSHFDVPVYDLNEFLINEIEIDRNFGNVPMNVTYRSLSSQARTEYIQRTAGTSENGSGCRICGDEGC